MTTQAATRRPPGKKGEDAKLPAPSATPDREESTSQEKQTGQGDGDAGEDLSIGSPGMGPGPATHVIGNSDDDRRVDRDSVEASIPSEPSTDDDREG